MRDYRYSAFESDCHALQAHLAAVMEKTDIEIPDFLHLPRNFATQKQFEKKELLQLVGSFHCPSMYGDAYMLLRKDICVSKNAKEVDAI